MVLGIQWLKTLGPIVWDFSTLTMQFAVNGETITLKRLKGGTIHVASKKQLSKLTKTASKNIFTMLLTEHSLLQLELMPLSKNLDSSKNEELQTLLE